MRSPVVVVLALTFALSGAGFSPQQPSGTSQPLREPSAVLTFEPASTNGHSRYPSRPRTITQAVQRGSLTVRQEAWTGRSAVMVARLRPARPGRVVELQEFRGVTWSVSRRAVQDEAGRVVFRWTPRSAGSFTYRAVALRHGGARRQITNTQVLRVADLGITHRVNPRGRAAAPSISADGRFVAYTSRSAGLVEGDHNDLLDVFVWDRQTGATQRVSERFGGGDADGASDQPAISADGRYVAFASEASNLTADGASGPRSVYLWDRLSGGVTAISRAPDGGEATGPSGRPTVSEDASRIAYSSLASNLVPGDANHAADVFVWDRSSRSTQLVSRNPAGRQFDHPSDRPDMSSNGAFVTFQTGADFGPGSPLRAYLWSQQSDRTELVSARPDGRPSRYDATDPSISDDGSYVAYTTWASDIVGGDTNIDEDIYVWHRRSGVTRRVSVSTDGRQANGRSDSSEISGDGRYVVFRSEATNLVPGDTNAYVDGFDATWDIFVHDREESVTRRINLGADLAEGDRSSFHPAISYTGAHVAYGTLATNLVPGVNTRDSVLTWSAIGR